MKDLQHVIIERHYEIFKHLSWTTVSRRDI